MSGNIAAGILEEAAKIVTGARNQTHGDKERSFRAIAKMWQVYLDNRKSPGADISGADVCAMMTLMKMARYQHGQPIRDHFVDMCGYAALAGELSCE